MKSYKNIFHIQFASLITQITDFCFSLLTWFFGSGSLSMLFGCVSLQWKAEVCGLRQWQTTKYDKDTLGSKQFLKYMSYSGDSFSILCKSTSIKQCFSWSHFTWNLKGKFVSLALKTSYSAVRFSRSLTWFT